MCNKMAEVCEVLLKSCQESFSESEGELEETDITDTTTSSDAATVSLLTWLYWDLCDATIQWCTLIFIRIMGISYGIICIFKIE